MENDNCSAYERIREGGYSGYIALLATFYYGTLYIGIMLDTPGEDLHKLSVAFSPGYILQTEQTTYYETRGMLMKLFRHTNSQDGL